MSTWLNEHEVADLERRLAHLPHAGAGARYLANLVDWTNRNSDGWPYWRKPARAAVRLQELLSGLDRWDPRDIEEAQLVRALVPIKAFLTRQGVPYEEVLS